MDEVVQVVVEPLQVMDEVQPVDEVQVLDEPGRNW
jgi:hypothetical protein